MFRRGFPLRALLAGVDIRRLRSRHLFIGAAMRGPCRLCHCLARP
jgi:hypothetical protein